MKKIATVVCLLSLLLVHGQIHSQETNLKTDLFVGVSIPELFHVGISNHYSPITSVGIKIGSDLKFGEETLYSYTLNHALLFGKTNSKVNQRLWSFNSGITWLVSNDEDGKWTTGWLNLYFAKEFMVVKNFGIQANLGYSIFLYDHYNGQPTDGCGHCLVNFGIPKIGITIFRKL